MNTTPCPWCGDTEQIEFGKDGEPLCCRRCGWASAKIGRNERCPCGSGLKWKRCHGR